MSETETEVATGSSTEQISMPLDVRLDYIVSKTRNGEGEQILKLNGEDELREALRLAREKYGISSFTEEKIEEIITHESQHYKKGEELFLGDKDITYAYALRTEKSPIGTVFQPTVNWNDGIENRTADREQWFLQRIVKITAAPSELSADDIAFLQEYRYLMDEETRNRWGHLIEDEEEDERGGVFRANNFSSDVLGEKPKSPWG